MEGGELFERIIDEDYHLTEVDCMVFVRQICDGITFMHHMRVLHLDLKVRRAGRREGREAAAPGEGGRVSPLGSLSLQPENILCVAATGHMVKIIDFGLARRYLPLSHPFWPRGEQGQEPAGSWGCRGCSSAARPGWGCWSHSPVWGSWAERFGEGE